MNCNPATTASFTGHRTYRGERAEALAQHLKDLYTEGLRTFISGMAVGFDLTAAEAVLALKAEHPDVQLMCAVPFHGQEAHFAPRDKERYRRVLHEASVVVYLCGDYHPGCYAQRNDFMVDNASVVVAWYNGSRGGTQYTVRRAERRGRRVIYL